LRRLGAAGSSTFRRARFSQEHRAMFRPSVSARAALENLEARRLLSTIDITDFGAIPNDRADDSTAIQRAIDSSSEGDAIFFPAGLFNLKRSLHLAGDRIYIASGAVLKARRINHIFVIQTDNVRIEGFVFSGKAIFLDKRDFKMNRNIVINDNTFHVHADGLSDNGITFTTGLRDSRITNNTFDPIGGDNAIYGYYWNHLTIANNEFFNGNQGIHVIDHRGKSPNLLIEQNYFCGLSRMGIEYQGGGRDTVVQDNYYEKPTMSRTFSKNMSTFAFSLIADRSKRTIVRRNTIIAPERPDGTGVRVGFEMGGDNALVEDNYSVGTQYVLSANDYYGSTSVLVRNNRFSDYLKDITGRGITRHDNDSDTELSWNIARGKPGRNKRLGPGGYVFNLLHTP
jgi:hypothetical protein